MTAMLTRFREWLRNGWNNANDDLKCIVIGLLVGTLTYVFISNVLIPYYSNKLIAEYMESLLTLTSEDIDRIDRFKKKPTPTIRPSGEYSGTAEISGKEVVIKYRFKQDTVYKEMVFKRGHITFSGSAKYTCKGSVMIYKEAAGDKVLFPKEGEAVLIPEKDLYFIYIHGTSPVELKPGDLIVQDNIVTKAIKNLLSFIFLLVMGVVVTYVIYHYHRSMMTYFNNEN